MCGFCGTSLAPAPETVVCANCGEENPAKFRLCGFCGTPLAAASAGAAAPTLAAGSPAAAPPAAASPPLASRATAAESVALPPQEIRKIVTLVFTDIKDSTALTGSIDAEAMNEIKARYFRTMATEIERHGGEVEKNIGDAIMAVFGRIRAHEDDALRAVRASHGMQRTLAQLNEEFERLYGVRITNRTGVNTGEIVANLDPTASQNLATGDAVNVAARLEQNAPAGEILIGEVTYELVRRQVEVERLELTLKGKPEPVPAFRLVDVHDAPAAGGEAPAALFVGREAEMDRLVGALASARGNRRAHLVTVVGDAGVGKTRLIADFVRRVSPEASVFRGRCLAYGEGITFWPLIEVVRSAARIGDDDAPETARSRIEALLPADDPDRDAIVDRVASAVGLSPSAHPVAELFWGARKLLEAQAAQRPLVIVVDDIHWAETTFLELLDHVVEASREAPILILCSARPDLADVHGEWLESANVERIDLAPLGTSDVEAMIDQLLAGSSLTAETRKRVVAAAEGNPLYVEQMISMLRDHDAGTEVVVPPTISALLAARLDALSRSERAVVDPAAVIGLVFAGAAIEHLVPDAVRPAVDQHLVDLDRKQFLHPLPTDGEEATFRFHHILVRDAAYQSLLKRARATLHERFVEWAEPVNRERGRETEFEEILGYHLEQAVRYRSELGPLDEQGRSIARRAASKLGSAGRRAFARGDTPAACNLLRRASALLPGDEPERVDLLGELVEALTEVGSFDEARTVSSEAIAIAERLGDRRLQARMRVGFWRLAFVLSELESTANALADANAAIDVLEELGDEAGLARAWRLVMLIHGTRGAYDDAAAAAEKVVEHARIAGDGRAASRGAMGYATTALHGPTPVAEALARCERLMDEVSGDRKAESVVLGVLAQLEAMRGDFQRGRALYQRAAQTLAELGTSVTSAALSTESSRVEALAGDFEAAERELRRDDLALEALGERYYRSTVDALLAQVLVTLDRLDEAEPFSRLGEALADADDVFSQVFWRTARARIYARTDHVADGERLAREAVDLARGTVDIALLAGALADFAEVLTRAGRHDEAEPPLREALELYERKGDVTSAVKLRRLLGEPTAV